MACIDYVPEELRCLRGFPVSAEFGSFFCQGKNERCPFITWEKYQSKGGDVVRPKSLFHIWRRS
jgi:hypothetical protein